MRAPAPPPPPGRTRGTGLRASPGPQHKGAGLEARPGTRRSRGFSPRCCPRLPPLHLGAVRRSQPEPRPRPRAPPGQARGRAALPPLPGRSCPPGRGCRCGGGPADGDGGGGDVPTHLLKSRISLRRAGVDMIAAGKRVRGRSAASLRLSHKQPAMASPSAGGGAAPGRVEGGERRDVGLAQRGARYGPRCPQTRRGQGDGAGNEHAVGQRGRS